MDPIIFRIGRPLTLLNVQLRQHYHVRAKERLDLAWEVLGALSGRKPPEPLPFVEITIWRHSMRPPDPDGLVASAKALLDVLQPASKRHPYGLGIIAGDDPEHLSLRVLHRQARSRAEQHTLVKIEGRIAEAAHVSADEVAA